MTRKTVLRRLMAGLRAVTWTGWAVAAIVVAAAVLAGLAGWIEAGVVAVVGSVCLLVGVGSVLGGSWAQVSILLGSTRAKVGETATGELRVHNPGERRVRAGVVELPVGGDAPQFVVPALGGGQTWSEVFDIPARRRGVVVLGPARSVRGDALGMLLSVRAWADPQRLIVHPRTVRVPFDATGFLSDAEGVTTAKLSSSDVSFHALRNYVPGDDRRHVHWPTTAREGQLMVRQFEETRRSHHVILLDTAAADWQPDAFELGISAAASLALAGLTRGRAVSFATSSGWVSTTSAIRMLDALAELTLDASPPALTDRVREVLAQRRSVSVLTVVCGPDMPDADIARWSSLAGPDVDTGVVRVSPGGTPARSQIGRTAVADCPALADLPRLVRRGGGS